MMLLRLALLGVLAGLTACGGSKDLTCNEERVYQRAVPAPRIQTPDDLDDLEPLKEMPLPEASPRAERAADANCLELPPSVTIE
jgi:hypothetical protein